jgi:nitroimidazol reductase NimA-like FMN-containing flavoprotein (pyridoxamine 5'-phosphate oxidase superfamily)/ribosomal protein S18 acetylase RimI-like enzyme
MRKEIFRMSRAEATALLYRAPFVRVASTDGAGAPLVRALNVAIVDGALVFHGAPVGEKTEAVGRPVVVSAEEMVASIPSYFVDPERACPATTLYRSVQVHGTLDPVEDPRLKARALAALLAKHQPEGGFVPMAHDHPLYAKVIEGLLVLSVSLEKLDGKAKLAQNRTPNEQRKILEGLWRRGNFGDVAAIDAIVAANPHTPLPSFLCAPEGLRLSCAPNTQNDADSCAALLEDTYWNDRFTCEEIASSHLASNAWVVARDGSGSIAASARAASDGVKYAWVYDVVVAPSLRGRKVGDAVVRFLLDHPAVRRTRFVKLGTRDAMGFYERLGFVRRESLPARPYASTEMVLVRPSVETAQRRAAERT